MYVGWRYDVFAYIRAKKIAICLVFLAKMQLKWFPIENGYWTGRRRYLVLLSTALGDFENGYWLNENGNWQNENGTWINLSTVLAQVIVRELTWFFFAGARLLCRHCTKSPTIGRVERREFKRKITIQVVILVQLIDFYVLVLEVSLFLDRNIS